MHMRIHNETGISVAKRMRRRAFRRPTKLFNEVRGKPEESITGERISERPRPTAVSSSSLPPQAFGGTTYLPLAS